jgi:hypothetical protein
VIKPGGGRHSVLRFSVVLEICAEKEKSRGRGESASRAWVAAKLNLLKEAHTQVRRGAQQHAQQVAGVEHIFIRVNYTIPSSQVNRPVLGT